MAISGVSTADIKKIQEPLLVELATVKQELVTVRAENSQLKSKLNTMDTKMTNIKNQTDKIK